MKKNLLLYVLMGLLSVSCSSSPEVSLQVTNH